MGIWSHTNHANQHRINDSPAPAIDSIYCVCRVEFISAYHFLSPVSTVVAVVVFSHSMFTYTGLLYVQLVRSYAHMSLRPLMIIMH